MLDTIIEQHPNHLIIIGGDLNTELKGNAPFDIHWSDFMTRHNLSCCDSFLPSDTYTYHHKSLDQKKWSDHFIVSDSLITNTISNHAVIDDGDNLSDHLPIILNLAAEIHRSKPDQTKTEHDAYLRWDKISDGKIQDYSQKLHDLVNLCPRLNLRSSCPNKCRCRDEACGVAIQKEYDFLVSCFQTADSCLPRFKPGTEKDWWNERLTVLKNQSIDIHSLWKSEGRPRQGPINDERLRVRGSYQQAIRAAQRAPKQAAWDRLHSALSDSDTQTFWGTWRRLYNANKSPFAPVVNGCSSKTDIANVFMHNFKSNSTPNNRDNVDRLDSRFTSAYSAYVNKHNASCDCKSSYFMLPDVIEALSSLKKGKSADESLISAEHLHNAPLNVLVRITDLFNQMMRHGYVPRQFRSGFMVPIIKDQQGNVSDPNNYRGITISPIISKLFEHVLKRVYIDHLSTSSHQFGFKKKSSTVHALHCLKETVTYYINNDSRVFCSFLDASKAFDRLVHSGLFIKLIERDTPLVFLDIIISWYDGLICRVKWDNHYSDWFHISAGVRQGGVLSPDFYSIYVDDLIKKLKQTNKGCYFGKHFAAGLFYADDMAILAPSIKGLQLLLDVCGDYCLEWDIALNAKKSRNLVFGKKIHVTHTLTLNNKPVDWTDKWPYLGIMLKSNKVFDCCIAERIRKFYRCANSILRIEGRSNETVMLRLLESHCVPILTYGIEIVTINNRDERRQLRVAYNSLFRKLFGYRWSESVTALQQFLSRPTWEQLVESRYVKFTNRVRALDSCNLAHALLN